jgi:hypothetical protein
MYVGNVIHTRGYVWDTVLVKLFFERQDSTTCKSKLNNAATP